MKKLLALILSLVLIISSYSVVVFATDSNTSVAKVGNTEYATIDEAIANWTAGSTLTLLANVTLSDVITLNSNEHHILNLGTYTMTAASGKHAIQIVCKAQGTATYCLTVNADATNPGGITANGKYCIYYQKGTVLNKDETKDRPIITINGGVFNGSYSINSYSSNKGTNCPQFVFNGGTFNGNVNLTNAMMRVFGGTFHGWINCTGDSSAYRLIAGGRFKSFQFMTADDNNTKFWIGTSMGNSDVGVYVDKDGYLVVGGPVITELSAEYPAVATNHSKWSSYLEYSSAATYGLFYEDADMAISKHGEANVTINSVPELPTATVNGYGYKTLEEAIAAANYVDEATVVLLKDVELDGYLTIASNSKVTIDLNGHTVSGTDTTEKNFGLIQNNGTFTINDSVGTGAIQLTATINSGWNRYSAVISNNPGGTLVVNGGNIEHFGGTDMAYGIDSLTNGTIGDVSVTINGGTVASTYRGIRQFLNSDSAENVLTVNGGTIKGDNKAIFFHDPSTKANNGTIIIKEDAEIYGDIYLFVTAGSTEWPVEVAIAADALKDSDVLSANVPEGLALENANGIYGVVEKVAIATVDGVNHYDLQSAINAAANGGTVALIANVELTANITIEKGADVTIDLNGYNITYTATNASGNSMITNNGKLTFNGEGNVTYTENGTAPDKNSDFACNLITNRGTLIVNGGTFTVETPVAGAFSITALVIDNYTNGDDSYVEINGGKFVSEYFRTIRLFATSNTYKNEVVINDGEFAGQVWLQSTGAGQFIAILTINGGEFAPRANDASSVYITTVTSTAINVAITDGTFNGKIGVDNTANISGFVTGGTFTATAKNGTNESVLADGFVFEENTDGIYGVVEKKEDPYKVFYIIDMKTEIDISGNTQYRVGFGAGIDSLNYSAVGFDIVAENGATLELKTTQVYDLFYIYNTDGSLNTEVQPSMLGGNYIFYQELLFPSSYDNMTINFRPFYITLSGEKVSFNKSYDIADIYTITVKEI